MKIVETYSHLNVLEYLLVHKPALWQEVRDVIRLVDGQACRTKISREKTMLGQVLYSPKAMNRAFAGLLSARGWKESRVQYWVTKSERLIRQTLTQPPEQQKAEIEAAGEKPIFSYNRSEPKISVTRTAGEESFVAPEWGLPLSPHRKRRKPATRGAVRPPSSRLWGPGGLSHRSLLFKPAVSAGLRSLSSAARSPAPVGTGSSSRADAGVALSAPRSLPWPAARAPTASGPCHTPARGAGPSAAASRPACAWAGSG